jgi:hypothetical protein
MSLYLIFLTLQMSSPSKFFTYLFYHFLTHSFINSHLISLFNYVQTFILEFFLPIDLLVDESIWYLIFIIPFVFILFVHLQYYSAFNKACKALLFNFRTFIFSNSHFFSPCLFPSLALFAFWSSE